MKYSVSVNVKMIVNIDAENPTEAEDKAIDSVVGKRIEVKREDTSAIWMKQEN